MALRSTIAKGAVFASLLWLPSRAAAMEVLIQEALAAAVRFSCTGYV